MKSLNKFVIAAAALACYGTASAGLHLNPLVGDNMVLQQKSNARLWGTATPGAAVTVAPSWGDAVEVKADGDGRWLAAVPTPEAKSHSHADATL